MDTSVDTGLWLWVVAYVGRFAQSTSARQRKRAKASLW